MRARAGWSLATVRHQAAAYHFTSLMSRCSFSCRSQQMPQYPMNIVSESRCSCWNARNNCRIRFACMRDEWKCVQIMKNDHDIFCGPKWIISTSFEKIYTELNRFLLQGTTIEITWKMPIAIRSQWLAWWTRIGIQMKPATTAPRTDNRNENKQKHQ